MMNIKSLSNKELYIKYQEAKTNFRKATEGSKKEVIAFEIFTELSQEVANREDFDWLSYKLEEVKNNQNKELTQGLTNYIESLQDGGIINLINFIEDYGIKVTDELLIDLYNNVKHLNIKSNESINNVPISMRTI